MNTLNHPTREANKPASFQERGVAVAFTTPQLAGARIRPAERTGTEFVVPNPAGGRGVYVLHWGAVRQLCKPTVHDTLLHQRIARLPVMDPGSVRRAARQVAAEGLAGREAAIAATEAIDADARDQTLINFLLLITLMEQIEPIGLRISAGTERTSELDQRAHRIVSRLGAEIGRGVARIGADLEALSGLFVATGLDAEAPPARLPELTERLRALSAELTAWAKQHSDGGFAPLAESLGRSAAVTARCAAATLRASRAMTRDMRGLIQAWGNDPAAVAKQISRPEWVLDGWEHLILLWESAGQISAQRAALEEMALLVPRSPREAASWGDEPADLENLEPVFRTARLNEGWRGGGASHGLIARNERFQALVK